MLPYRENCHRGDAHAEYGFRRERLEEEEEKRDTDT